MIHVQSVVSVVLAVMLTVVVAVAAPVAAAPPEPRDTDDACPEGQVPEDGFRDVSDDNVHESAIDCAVEWGLARGRTNESYGPAEILTRAQTASFVARLLEASLADLSPRPRDHFGDDAASVHHLRINQLAEVDVVSGRKHRTYAPAAAASRGELATVLVRGIEYRIRDELPLGRDYFGDDDGSVHERNINKAAEAGVIVGTSGEVYAPRSPVRRDQLASFLVRALELLLDRGYRPCPAIYPPFIRIAAVHADAGGDDGQGNREYVELLSDWCDNIDLDGWYLRDADGNTITISGENLIQPQTTFRVYTGSGEDAEDRHYAGHREPVWDDDGDTATLYAPGDKEADRLQY